MHDSDLQSDLEIKEIQMQDLNKPIHESDAKSSDDKEEVAEETIEKIQPNLEKNEIQMQDLDKHIDESDAKSINDKQEVADETIEKVVQNGKTSMKGSEDSKDQTIETQLPKDKNHMSEAHFVQKKKINQKSMTSSPNEVETPNAGMILHKHSNLLSL